MLGSKGREVKFEDALGVGVIIFVCLLVLWMIITFIRSVIFLVFLLGIISFLGYIALIIKNVYDNYREGKKK